MPVLSGSYLHIYHLLGFRTRGFRKSEASQTGYKGTLDAIRQQAADKLFTRASQNVPCLNQRNATSAPGRNYFCILKTSSTAHVIHPCKDNCFKQSPSLGHAGTYVQDLSGKCPKADEVDYGSSHGALYWMLSVDRSFQESRQHEQQSARSATLQ